jgi:serine acetyltransferase
MKMLELIRTDLVQAKILNDHEHFSWFRFIYLFIRSRTCKIHTFVRMRSSNPLAAFIARLCLDRFLIEIGSKTQIGKYFFMPHPRCIIISSNVIIGDHVHVGQQVTIGGNFKKNKSNKLGEIQKLPILGNRINILPGAVIGGPVILNDDIIVGANAVVTRDVPSNTIVFGQNQFANKKIKIPNEGGSFVEILNK